MADEHTEAAREAARELLDDVSSEFLGRPGVAWGRMFSGQGLGVRGKIFAVASLHGGLMVKIPEQRADELIAAGTVTRMVMRGRSMREWVTMPVSAGHEAWRDLVDEAYVYLDEITPR